MYDLLSVKQRYINRKHLKSNRIIGNYKKYCVALIMDWLIIFLMLFSALKKFKHF